MLSVVCVVCLKGGNRLRGIVCRCRAEEGKRGRLLEESHRCLVRSPALQTDRFERAGVCAELPRRLLRQLLGVESRGRAAPHRAEAGVRRRRREGLCRPRRVPAGARLGKTEVVGRRQVELGRARRRCRLGEGPVECRPAQRRRARGRARCG